MRKFKTSKEGIEFWERFNSPFGTTGRMSDYWWNKLDKAGELGSEEKEPVYKKKNEWIWDMFSDWEDVISRIDCDLHSLYHHCDLQTEEERVEYLNDMLVEYERYLQW